MSFFATTLDLLYFTITICVSCITILMSILLIKWIRISSDIQTISELGKETIELVNNYAWKPLEVLMSLRGYIVDYLKGKADKKSKK